MKNAIANLVLGCTLSASFISNVTAGPVADAAASGNVGELSRLLAEGAPVDEGGMAAPLYFAAREGHVGAVELLIAGGADVNLLSPWGGALHTASQNGHAMAVEILLRNDADPNLKGGENNRTPLHDAARSGAFDVAELLIDYGADVNARATGRDKGPPVHFAASRGYDNVVDLLQRFGAQPRAVEAVTIEELAAADLELGKAQAAACTPCHTYNPGDPGERGPSLWGIVGRPIASVDDFPFTDAMRELDGYWDFETLNGFIADVLGSVPGTGMYTGSVPDREDRIALIAYLRMMSDNPIPLE